MYYLFVTRNGKVKKTDAAEYENIRQSGLIAINLDKDDMLLGVKSTTGKDRVLIVTTKGKCITFDENDIRPTGRATQGVRGIRLGKDDFVVGMDVITTKDQKQAEQYEVMVLSSNGHGKKTKLSGYKVQSRGGQGVFTAKLNKKTGNLVEMRVLRNHVETKKGKAKDAVENEVMDLDNPKDLLVISKFGQTIRLPLEEVPTLGRHTQGVRIIRLNENDEATALALL